MPEIIRYEYTSDQVANSDIYFLPLLSRQDFASEFYQTLFPGVSPSDLDIYLGLGKERLRPNQVGTCLIPTAEKDVPVFYTKIDGDVPTIFAKEIKPALTWTAEVLTGRRLPQIVNPFIARLADVLTSRPTDNPIEVFRELRDNPNGTLGVGLLIPIFVAEKTHDEIYDIFAQFNGTINVDELPF